MPDVATHRDRSNARDRFFTRTYKYHATDQLRTQAEPTAGLKVLFCFLKSHLPFLETLDKCAVKTCR